MVFAHAVQRIVRSTGLPPSAQSGAISAVFQFTYGFGTSEGNFKRRCAQSGMTEDEYYAQAMDAFGEEPTFAKTLEAMEDVLSARARRDGQADVGAGLRVRPRCPHRGARGHGDPAQA